MVYELKEADYEKARTLFQSLEYQPMCDAVLDGIYPGRVFVDAPALPRTAFLSTFLSSEDVFGFLVGNPDNDVFNRALNKTIYDGGIISQKCPYLWLTCQPEDWHGQLPVVLAPREPIPILRHHYVCRELKYDWRANVPNGFAVRRMDESLLSQPGLKVPDDVRKTMEKWKSIADARLKDFGFVTIRDDPTAHAAEVVSWATVDFIAGGIGDAGVFTVERYRRRGLATVTAAAAVDYGLSQGLSLINWTCHESNMGSIRTAEKLGCERRSDYRMHLLVFD